MFLNDCIIIIIILNKSNDYYLFGNASFGTFNSRMRPLRRTFRIDAVVSWQRRRRRDGRTRAVAACRSFCSFIAAADLTPGI